MAYLSKVQLLSTKKLKCVPINRIYSPVSCYVYVKTKEVDYLSTFWVFIKGDYFRFCWIYLILIYFFTSTILNILCMHNTPISFQLLWSSHKSINFRSNRYFVSIEDMQCHNLGKDIFHIHVFPTFLHLVTLNGYGLRKSIYLCPLPAISVVKIPK